ncbi:unnamed protein product, partial [Lymnaea stagnalis]
MGILFYTLMLLLNGIITGQRIKEFLYSDVDCSHNCSKNVSSSFDKCFINYLINIETSVSKKPLITFEIKEMKGLKRETLFTMDLDSHCNGYKENVGFYCTEKELDVYILSINANKLKINDDAEIRLYFTTSDGNKVYSGYQHLPKVYGFNSATGQLKINGRKILSKKNCNLTVKEKYLFLEFHCVNSASSCITEIKVNDAIVSKNKGEYTSYKQNYENRVTLNVTITLASCIYMSCTVITDFNETTDVEHKSNQSKESKLHSSEIKLHFLLVVGVPLIGGLFLSLVVTACICWLISRKVWCFKSCNLRMTLGVKGPLPPSNRASKVSSKEKNMLNCCGTCGCKKRSY